jgi:hypothetical protein
MATLHIEHAITDLPTWLGAFEHFAEARAGAGVRQTRVHQPVDDDRYIYVQLDFDDEEAATAFLGFLRSVVWARRGVARPRWITHWPCPDAGVSRLRPGSSEHGWCRLEQLMPPRKRHLPMILEQHLCA